MKSLESNIVKSFNGVKKDIFSLREKIMKLEEMQKQILELMEDMKNSKLAKSKKRK